MEITLVKTRVKRSNSHKMKTQETVASMRVEAESQIDRTPDLSDLSPVEIPEFTASLVEAANFYVRHFSIMFQTI